MSSQRIHCIADSSGRTPARRRLLARLGEVLQHLEHCEDRTRQRAPAPGEVVSSGSHALDRRLAFAGFRRGTLVEWLSGGRAVGAGTLALGTAVRAAAAGGAIVVVDRARRFYPPAAVLLGLDPARLILLRPRMVADEMWALDQALRTAGVAATVWWGGAIDGRHYRRLQLGCQRSGALGLLVRPASLRSEPSWADVRLLVEPRPRGAPSAASRSARASGRHVRIEVLRCRGVAGGGAVELEIDDETGTLRETDSGRLDSQLVPGPTAQRAARA